MDSLEPSADVAPTTVTVDVGAAFVSTRRSSRVGRFGDSHLPNFASGRRVMMFADESSLALVHSILHRWPEGLRGTLWVDTRNPRDVADLPVVDGVGVVSFHVDVGFDPLVTAARRVELDVGTTVWAAGAAHRMAAIRATCLAAGLPEDHTRVFDCRGEGGLRITWSETGPGD